MEETTVVGTHPAKIVLEIATTKAARRSPWAARRLL